MSVDQHFNTVNEKLQQLIKQLRRLQRENERLAAELVEARQHQAATRQRTEALQQQNAVLKLAAGEMDKKEKKEFERQIEGYLREIDKCISFLSR